MWIESCSSGGGRADLGILARTDWVWPSDHTDARTALDPAGLLLRALTPHDDVLPASPRPATPSFGLRVPLTGDYASELVVLQRVAG